MFIHISGWASVRGECLCRSKDLHSQRKQRILFDRGGMRENPISAREVCRRGNVNVRAHGKHRNLLSRGRDARVLKALPNGNSVPTKDWFLIPWLEQQDVVVVILFFFEQLQQVGKLSGWPLWPNDATQIKPHLYHPPAGPQMMGRRK